MDDTQQQIAQIQSDIAKVASTQPIAVLICAIEMLIEVSAGDNTALRDYNKLQMYRGIRHFLAKRGIRT